MCCMASSIRESGWRRGIRQMAQDQMAQEQVLAPGIPLTLADRPAPVRWAVALGRFMRTKPLGGFGLMMIVLLVFMAVFANAIDRVDPNEVSRVPAQNCTAEQVDDPTVDCFSPELLAQAETDATVR